MFKKLLKALTSSISLNSDKHNIIQNNVLNLIYQMLCPEIGYANLECAI